jgi:hypothetical protein
MMANQEKKAGDTTGSSLLNQLITSMEEAEIKLEDAYKKNDADQVNSAKTLILQIQKKIAEGLK